MTHILLKQLLLLITLFSAEQVFAKQNIDFFIYVDKPPFVIDKHQQTGLSYEFISALNNYSNKYHYHLSYAPKQRAFHFSQSYGGVLWTNPLWVGDQAMVKYNWITDLVFESEFYITNDPELTFESHDSLLGKIIVGVRGYTYPNLEALFSNEKAIRVDVHNETMIPLMLLKDRADVGVVGLQTYIYLKALEPALNEKLHILTNYKNDFYRSILIDKSKPEVKQDIEGWMNSKEGSLHWQRLKDKWLYNG